MDTNFQKAKTSPLQTKYIEQEIAYRPWHEAYQEFQELPQSIYLPSRLRLQNTQTNKTQMVQ